VRIELFTEAAIQKVANEDQWNHEDDYNPSRNFQNQRQEEPHDSSLSFSPPFVAISLAEIGSNSNTGACCDDFYVRDWANKLKPHSLTA